MKLCIDCKYCVLKDKVHMCNKRVSPVDGEPKASCSAQRNTSQWSHDCFCGMEGKAFEQKDIKAETEMLYKLGAHLKPLPKVSWFNFLKAHENR